MQGLHRRLLLWRHASIALGWLLLCGLHAAAAASPPTRRPDVGVPMMSPAAPPPTRPQATAAAGAGAAAAAAGAKQTSAAAGASPPRAGRPSRYPFPQCMTTTLSYDTYFVGQVKYLQVGTVRYAYHRFGPFTKTSAQQQQQQQVADERGSRGAGAGAARQQRERAPLVFISGLGTSMYMWPIPLLTSLADTREVIIFDNMRSGLSTDTSSAPLTLPLMANSTMALIARLGLRRPDVWGWSLGGCVAYALLAGGHGGKLNNVIIASGSPGGPASFLPPPSVLSDLAAAGNKLSRLLPLLFPKGVEDKGVCAWFAAFNSFSATEYTSMKDPIDTKALQEQLAALVQFFTSPGAARGLASASNRVLIMHGVQDRVVPVRNAQGADNLMLGSWMLQFPSAGHALPFSHQQAVGYMTDEFLSFAEPLSPAEQRQWMDYGVPSSTWGLAAGGGDDGAGLAPPTPAPDALVPPATLAPMAGEPAAAASTAAGPTRRQSAPRAVGSVAVPMAASAAAGGAAAGGDADDTDVPLAAGQDG